MNVGSRFVHAADQHFDIRIDNHFIVVVVTQLESVVEEDVSLDFVVIRIHYLYLN